MDLQGSLKPYPSVSAAFTSIPLFINSLLPPSILHFSGFLHQHLLPSIAPFLSSSPYHSSALSVALAMPLPSCLSIVLFLLLSFFLWPSVSVLLFFVRLAPPPPDSSPFQSPPSCTVKMEELQTIKRELTLIKVQIDGLLDSLDRMDQQRRDRTGICERGLCLPLVVIRGYCPALIWYV